MTRIANLMLTFILTALCSVIAFVSGVGVVVRIGDKAGMIEVVGYVIAFVVSFSAVANGIYWFGHIKEYDHDRLFPDAYNDSEKSSAVSLVSMVILCAVLPLGTLLDSPEARQFLKYEIVITILQWIGHAFTALALLGSVWSGLRVREYWRSVW